MISPFYDYKTGFSQTYFLSRVVKDAKRSPKISFFIQKNGLDALRWTNPIAVILQISRITSLLAALRALARLPLPRLSSRGSFPGSPFAIVAGTGRIESTPCLIHNGLIPPILGLTDFPHRDTLRTFLWRFSPKQLQSLQLAHDRLRHELFQRLGLLYSAIVDADTTTPITYGSQEGTALGYIPKRRHGQPSYAPILSSARGAAV